ncbi:hypothetical protein HK100_008449, partial [Physocladia obscura]
MGLIMSIAERFERSIPELDEHRGRLKDLVAKLEKNFRKLKTKVTVQTIFSLQVVDYSSTASILENARPTENIIQFLADLNDLLHNANNSAKFRKIVSEIIGGVFDHILVSMETSAATPGNALRFGFCGVQQLVLDIHFFLLVAERFVTSTANETANKICERALRFYFTQNSKIRAPLK